MYKLIDFIKRFREYVTFTILVIFSLFLMSVADLSEARGFRTMIVGAIGFLQDVANWIPANKMLEMENKTIRQINLENSSQITNLRKAIIENKSLRKLVGLKNSISYDYITSEVIGKSKIAMRDYLTLNSGADNEIQDGMTAINDAGLIGNIIGTSDNYCMVELIANRDIQVASRVQSSRIDGMLVWSGGNNFLLKYIPKSYNVSLGDTIISSNFSNKYPPNIPIGHVVEITEKPGDMFLHIAVRSFVDFHNIEVLFLLKFIPDPERRELIRSMDKMLQARNTRK